MEAVENTAGFPRSGKQGLFNSRLERSFRCPVKDDDGAGVSCGAPLSRFFAVEGDGGLWR